MTWNLLFSILVLAAAVASYPLDHSGGSSKDASKYMNNEDVSTSSSGDSANEIFDNYGDEESSSSDERTEDEGSGGEEQQPEFCTRPSTYTVDYKAYKIVNGEFITYNATKVINSRKCCEGYSPGVICRLNLCQDRICQDEPQSICVTLKWCGDFVPVFITNTGLISDVCTQPNKTQELLNMCPNNTSSCQDTSQCNEDEAVCINTKCDCTPGPVWLKLNGQEALC